MQVGRHVRAHVARSTALLAAVLLVGGLALTACGDEGTADFAASYEAVTADYREALEQAQAAGRSAGADPTAVYAQLRDATRTAAGRYRDLDAPDAADDEFAALTRELDQQVEALDRVLQAAQHDDTTAVRAGLSDYATAIGAWQQARHRVDAVLERASARAGP